MFRILLNRYIPGQAEFKEVEKLGSLFLGDQVDKLNRFIDGTEDLNKDEVHKSLKLISGFLLGKRL